MMSDTYVECMVKKRTSILMQFLKILTIMLAVVFILLGCILWPALIIGILMAVAAYFVYLNTDLEYEYLYLDKEISVDKVMAKSKRKKVAQYDVQRMEILAPMNSYRLDGYKNRKVKTVDYSSGVAGQPDTRYVMYYEGDLKIIFEPNAKMVHAIKNVAPRKVFTD